MLHSKLQLLLLQYIGTTIYSLSYATIYTQMPVSVIDICLRVLNLYIGTLHLTLLDAIQLHNSLSVPC